MQWDLTLNYELPKSLCPFHTCIDKTPSSLMNSSCLLMEEQFIKQITSLSSSENVILV